MAPKKDEIEIHRNSKTGRFVTERYVEKHPDTTETEHRPKPKPGGGGGKKK